MAFQVSGGVVKDASVDCATVICFLSVSVVLQVLLPGVTRPTWAYPAHFALALAFSVLPMLRPLTRLAVGSARSRAERGGQRFHVLRPSQDDLGSLSTSAVLRYASGDEEAPEPDRLPFGPSLKQSLVACL